MRGVDMREKERSQNSLYIRSNTFVRKIHYKMKYTQCHVYIYPLQSIYAQCNVSIYLVK